MISMKREGEWLLGTLGEQEAALSFGDLLRKRWGFPKKTAHLLFQNKEIMVNGQPATQVQKTESGQHIAIRVCQEEELGLEPVKGYLQIAYEDDHILIVDKPAGLLLHPTEITHHETLDHWVAGYFQEQNIKNKVRHIHRLDQDTSGLVMYAKHSLAGAMLAERLERRDISRQYIAFVEGIMQEEQGKIDAPIGKDRHHATRRRVSPQGDQAITHFHVIERYRDTTQVSCRLDTGRTHQIRVHFAYLGYPLIGDILYGARKNQALQNRQALHAAKLHFIHPFGEEHVEVTAKLPQDLQELKTRL
ncbi:RluA family pseudouridine synthase [Brevibacillus laterosporus]|uniref:Pseudouridine synthase n=1 Tax=Brevibacillus halotolerans TaxID=1507437 RepID=A0ABT4I2T0_9BACL|nr:MULTISPECIES: RluA family pseudouridine synthase [Brevibacillus]MCR8987425.1 RluA family pseudouridine synthase [Brevibacillus laterosporus]MCZ0833163.1 RluA family pseudouridine synthase [Brevibacillus halotolerans]